MQKLWKNKIVFWIYLFIRFCPPPSQGDWLGWGEGRHSCSSDGCDGWSYIGGWRTVGNKATAWLLSTCDLSCWPKERHACCMLFWYRAPSHHRLQRRVGQMSHAQFYGFSGHTLGISLAHASKKLSWGVCSGLMLPGDWKPLHQNRNLTCFKHFSLMKVLNLPWREDIESFIAELTVPPEMQAMGIVTGMPDRATVNIIDDEG